MKKQQKQILGVLALIVLIAIVGINNPFSFYKANFPAHTIEKISSEGVYPTANSMTIKVNAFIPGGGNLNNEPSCNVNGINDLTLGGTTGNDDGHVVFGDSNEFYQYARYPLTNIQVENVKVKRYWACSSNSPSSQTTDAGMTATLDNVTGYCEIQNAFNVNCLVTGGKFRAFYNNQEITGEDGLAYYGITSISGEFTILKNGIQCTQNQLALCGEGNFVCENNKCVQKMITPPLTPTQTLTDEKTTEVIDENTTKTTEVIVISGETVTITTLENLTTITTMTSYTNKTSGGIVTTLKVENKTSDTTLILYGIGLIVFVLLLGFVWWKTKK